VLYYSSCAALLHASLYEDVFDPHMDQAPAVVCMMCTAQDSTLYSEDGTFRAATCRRVYILSYYTLNIPQLKCILLQFYEQCMSTVQMRPYLVHAKDRHEVFVWCFSGVMFGRFNGTSITDKILIKSG
jgi:hypothetical protein